MVVFFALVLSCLGEPVLMVRFSSRIIQVDLGCNSYHCGLIRNFRLGKRVLLSLLCIKRWIFFTAVGETAKLAWLVAQAL